MIKTLGQTTNFTIKYQDDLPNAKHRAHKLMGVIESDFSTLRAWFKNVDGFGPSNRITVQLEGSQGGGWNQGYSSSGKTKIVADPYDANGTDPVADDCVMGIFVAEAIEVLMSWLNQHTGKTTWDAGGSNGEGLSRVAFGLLHPVGYYRFFGPCVNPWLLKNPRPDWLKTTEASDTDSVSYAEATLFIYWLHSERGYSWEDIVLKAGATLNDTYHALSGQNDAKHDFTTFIEPYLPTGKSDFLDTDDPFPLKKGQQSVSLVCEEAPNGTSTVVDVGSAKVTPVFCAESKSYKYQTLDTPVSLTCTATPTGFAVPRFTWKLNGNVVAVLETMTISATVTKDDPNDPMKPLISIQDISVYCTRNWPSDGSQAEVLTITSKDHLGHEGLAIEVQVQELHLPSHQAASYAMCLLDTQAVKYEDAYYEDGSACRAAMLERLSEYKAYNPIPLYLTLPDPPPELRRAAHLIEQMRKDVEVIARTDAHLAAHLAKSLSASLGVSAHVFNVHARSAPSSG
jgi:hypothetical protein